AASNGRSVSVISLSHVVVPEPAFRRRSNRAMVPCRTMSNSADYVASSAIRATIAANCPAEKLR
ncbi:hypothetical protein NL405_28075, partial [Klebsiella pneumoniae]|nr:hypothetical protein [Klebsiella pneumoniae]